MKNSNEKRTRGKKKKREDDQKEVDKGRRNIRTEIIDPGADNITQVTQEQKELMISISAKRTKKQRQ